MKKLRLFVWRGVLEGFSDGIIFALAPDAEGARRAVIENSAARDTAILLREMGSEPEVYDTPYGVAVWGGG